MGCSTSCCGLWTAPIQGKWVIEFGAWHRSQTELLIEGPKREVSKGLCQITGNWTVDTHKCPSERKRLCGIRTRVYVEREWANEKGGPESLSWSSIHTMHILCDCPMHSPDDISYNCLACCFSPFSRSPSPPWCQVPVPGQKFAEPQVSPGPSVSCRPGLGLHPSSVSCSSGLSSYLKFKQQPSFSERDC